MGKTKELYKKIQTGRAVYIINYDRYDGECPKLLCAKVKKKRSHYYGSYTVETNIGTHHLNHESLMFTSRKDANSEYTKKLQSFKKGIVQQQQKYQKNIDQLQRKLDEANWRLNKVKSY